MSNETWPYEQAQRLIRPGMFVIDIGANDGSAYTRMMLERVAPGGTVWAFEPGPAEFQQLLQLKAPDSVSYRPVNIALSDKNDVRDVYHYQYWSLIDKGKDEQKENYAIKTDREFFTCTFDRLDDIIDRRMADGSLPDDQKVGFIKLDVDGQEAPVLRGALNTLLRDKPPILVELGHFVARYFGESIEGIAKLLIGMGYVGSCFDMHDVGDPQVIANRTPSESTVDFLFVQRRLTLGTELR